MTWDKETFGLIMNFSERHKRFPNDLNVVKAKTNSVSAACLFMFLTTIVENNCLINVAYNPVSLH
jgi:hypothetical protein